ncbi:DUF4326 domain-containing protein [Pseudonocardia nematodicida]|uniref:DUF4326 domain-containing protein n=1 Tax=Pseudonocardia nematodicida TaxID=1206997 RepID=A0ABV1K9X2_9PSEU
MALPRRIRLRRSKGWRKPDGAVVVTRPGPWGNPFDVRELGRERAIAAHRDWLLADRPDLVARARAELAGRDLCCWCPEDVPCHADTLLEVANS